MQEGRQLYPTETMCLPSTRARSDTSHKTPGIAWASTQWKLLTRHYKEGVLTLCKQTW